MVGDMQTGIQSQDADDMPIVCTLSDAQAADQILEWGDLQTVAIDVVAIDAGMRMLLPAAMLDSVEDLVQRESQCCAFLTITTSVEAEQLILEVTSANPEALPVISMLAGIAIGEDESL